ncbi:hypothetical protein ACLOJK_019664 [Asimina triloba]
MAVHKNSLSSSRSKNVERHLGVHANRDSVHRWAIATHLEPGSRKTGHEQPIPTHHAQISTHLQGRPFGSVHRWPETHHRPASSTVSKQQWQLQIEACPNQKSDDDHQTFQPASIPKFQPHPRKQNPTDPVDASNPTLDLKSSKPPMPNSTIQAATNPQNPSRNPDLAAFSGRLADCNQRTQFGQTQITARIGPIQDLTGSIHHFPAHSRQFRILHGHDR